MVASSSLSPSAKLLPLSYAERAKKAQSIKSPIEVVQPQPQRPPLPQSQPTLQPPIPVTPSLSSTSTSSTKSTSAALPSTPALVPTLSSAAPLAPASAPGASEARITNGDSHATTTVTARPTSSTDAQPSPQKPTPVNFWDRRKEELAARNAPPQKTTPSQPPASAPRSATVAPTSSARDTASQNDGASISADTGQPPPPVNDDDDPFVVRKSRAPRPPVPVPSSTLSAENADDWPEVGKAVTISTYANSPVTGKGDESRTTNGDNVQSTTSRKSGPPKWIPLPLQPPPESQSQSRRDHSAKGNRQSANTNTQRPSSNSGQGRSSRNQSGRNSTTHSANASRVHSNAGSAHSSPRNLLYKRLPEEAASVSASGSTRRSSRTGSPIQIAPSSQAGGVPSHLPTTGTNDHPSNYGGYLSPQGPTPYYPQQSPTVPPISSPAYGSSQGPLLGVQADLSLPMHPPVHGYPYIYPNPYVSYEYGPPSGHYPYWGGHSHPDSGQHSPAYPPSAASSNYATSLPLHVQQHFYPPPLQHQPSHQPHSSVPNATQLSSAGSDNGNTSESSHVSIPEASTDVGGLSATNEEQTIDGRDRRPAPVVFGSIAVSDDPCLIPSTQAMEGVEGSDAKDSIEKAFTTLAIGVASTDTLVKARKTSKAGKATRPSAGAGEEREERIKGEPVIDAAIAKEAVSTGETKWKFGNEGLPTGGEVVDAEANTSQHVEVPSSLQDTGTALLPHPLMGDERLGDEFKVKNFGYGFGAPSGVPFPTDVVRDDTSASQAKEGTGEEQDGEYDAPSTDIARGEVTGVQLPQGPSSGGNGRPRRGAYGGGYGFERGGYAGRRGRGINGFARGYGRGFGRGNNGANHSGNSYSQRQAPPPFSVTSPPPFQGIASPVGDPSTNYYASRPPASFIPTGYDAYTSPAPPPQSTAAPTAPPMPVPLSQLSFPLDPTRFYLLGQLEYYLSPQNMAQDFFLRQRMDSCGWIPVGLIASFNRVTRLTLDYQLVLDVLMLSALVQVKDHHVRMEGWERFVLPDAPPSIVTSEDGLEYPHYPHDTAPGEETNVSGELTGVPGVLNEEAAPHWTHSTAGDVEGEDEEDEEEDDVVFVMGKDEGEGMWSHEKRT